MFSKVARKNHQHFDETLLNCWDWSGAKECKSCKSRDAENEYLLGKIGVDTAENGPKVDVSSNLLPVLLILSLGAAAIYVACSLHRWIGGQLGNSAKLRRGVPAPRRGGPPRGRRCARPKEWIETMSWIICKLWEPRSRLYRTRFLQVNTHFAELF